MQECSRCGGQAIPDPEHLQVIRCLSCWLAWALPHSRRCSGVRNHLAPGLRMLEERRDLNR